jgi:hypothetical protein
MSSPRQIADFLDSYPVNVRETALATRALLISIFPKVVESLNESAKLIGYQYGPGYKGLICTLIMSQTGVKLGIFRGAELADPQHLMAGAGKVHRHVQLRSPADLKRPGLTKLLTEALRAWRARNSLN